MTSTPPPATGAAAQSLVDVHDGLRLELEQVRRLVREVVDGVTPVGTARGELQRLSLRRHDWTTGAYCSAHCLAVAQHHYGEDTEIFPLLRRFDAGLDPVLRRLEAEHVTIHHLLDDVDEALVGLVTGATDAKAALTGVLDTFAATLTAHLAREEDDLLGPMARAFG